MLPNFLIVGAAKAGTTSIYQYLKQHPDVYMSPIKEPKFLTSQFLKFPHKGPGDTYVDRNVIRNFDEYKALFAKAACEKAVGEASADNLYYFEGAISNMKKYLGDIKIIVILRNPVERAYSAYLHLVRDGRETLGFEEALEAESTRRDDNWEFIWFYKEAGFYCTQVRAYLDAFGEKKVRVYLFDDLRESAEALMSDIYRFIGVADSFVPRTERYNVSGIPKSRTLHNFLVGPTPIGAVSRYLIPKKARRRLKLILRNINLKKPMISPHTRNRLTEVYRDDIKGLEKLIGRDLSSWLA